MRARKQLSGRDTPLPRGLASRDAALCPLRPASPPPPARRCHVGGASARGAPLRPLDVRRARGAGRAPNGRNGPNGQRLWWGYLRRAAGAPSPPGGGAAGSPPGDATGARWGALGAGGSCGRWGAAGGRSPRRRPRRGCVRLVMPVRRGKGSFSRKRGLVGGSASEWLGEAFPRSACEYLPHSSLQVSLPAWRSSQYVRTGCFFFFSDSWCFGSSFPLLSASWRLRFSLLKKRGSQQCFFPRWALYK